MTRPSADELTVGHEVDVEVGPVAHGGHCVARHEGRVLFVRHSLPGERVRARITEGGPGDRFLRADAIEVLEASAHRVAPRCPVSGPGGCGGCDFQHVETAHQRELKATVVAEQLSRLGGVEREVVVEPLADDDGLRYAGDADFGPMGDDGLREVGGDYNDFLEITVSHPDKKDDPPEKKDKNALDCSGFLRMVLGYRMDYPMFGKNETKGDGLQRQVQGMVDLAPGVLLHKDNGKKPEDLDKVTENMLPGDIVFFETDGEPGLDHSGFYMGKDSQGKHRFMSSREAINGPTMGDVKGPSILDGNGLFANNFRAVRRL